MLLKTFRLMMIIILAYISVVMVNIDNMHMAVLCTAISVSIAIQIIEGWVKTLDT